MHVQYKVTNLFQKFPRPVSASSRQFSKIKSSYLQPEEPTQEGAQSGYTSKPQNNNGCESDILASAF